MVWFPFPKVVRQNAQEGKEPSIPPDVLNKQKKRFPPDASGFYEPRQKQNGFNSVEQSAVKPVTDLAKSNALIILSACALYKIPNFLSNMQTVSVHQCSFLSVLINIMVQTHGARMLIRAATMNIRTDLCK